jgi:tRNA 5-methylaminomethyl-2-thiouridine biosynthesis bifunctional protein
MDEFSWTEEGTLYSENYQDIYFSDGHGLGETEHVFINGNNILGRLQHNSLVIGELGFGTGLNFLVTWREWLKNCTNKGRLIFISCEKHPLSRSVLETCHNNFPELSELSSQLRDKWPRTDTGFHTLEFEQGKVTLLLMLGDVVDVFKQLEAKIDAWYLDGFSPSSNPEMWTEDVFKQIAAHSHSGTTLTTYSAAGFVRRGLKAVGFDVSRVKGFGKKLHMTSAIYKGYEKERINIQPWFQLPTKSKPQKVAVIGAGMAGLNSAWSLGRLGVDVTVFDKHSKPAAEASGNLRGMMFPLISKKPDRLGNLTEIGAAYSFNQFKGLGLDFDQGLLEFASDDKKQSRFEEAVQRYGSNYIELLSPREIEERFSFKSELSALWHETAVSLSPVDYANALIENGSFDLKLDSEVLSISKVDEKWVIDVNGSKTCFDCVVVASANNSKNFIETLPLRKTRGQVLELDNDHFVKCPGQGLNFINYLVPCPNGKYLLGATFQVDDDGEELRLEDSRELLDSVRSTFPGVLKEFDPGQTSGRVSFRAMLHDYFPVIGPVADEQFYNEKYSELKHGKPISSYESAEYEKGLYLLSGLGSRGLTLSPLAGAYLAHQIVDGLSLLPVNTAQSVHPARFIVKKLKKGKKKNEPG